ncbi:DUF2807 domain-containing protein [soil metagenome]
MIRTLLIIAGAAFVLALASLGGAVAVGGRDMAAHGWSWTFPGMGDGGDLQIVRETGNGPVDASRTLAWTGTDTLEIDLPADVTYVQGATPGIVVTCPADQVDRVRVDGDRLTWSGSGGDRNGRITFGPRGHGTGMWVRDDDVHVVVTAPAVTRFKVLGSGSLALRDYDQAALAIDLSGSGDVAASGRTTALTLDISGSGDANLEDLLAGDAHVDVSGSGDARVAPTGSAEITLSGSGDASLATRPTSLRQSITGSGDITQD